VKVGAILPDDGGRRFQALAVGIEVIALTEQRHIAADQLLRLRQRRQARRRRYRQCEDGSSKHDRLALFEVALFELDVAFNEERLDPARAPAGTRSALYQSDTKCHPK
jgi:hypothetical protein